MNVLEDITNFIFLQQESEPADIVFIPGNNRPEPMEHAVTLWKQGYAPVLMPSGRFSITKGFFGGSKDTKKYPGPYATECEFLTDVAVRGGVPSEHILKESRATYTMQNAVFSRELADLHGLRIRKAILCCKCFHARRAYMYYQYAFPETEFRISPVEVDGIGRENWFLTKKGIDTVMGELSRCGTQFPDLIQEFARRNPMAAQPLSEKELLS